MNSSFISFYVVIDCFKDFKDQHFYDLFNFFFFFFFLEFMHMENGSTFFSQSQA